MIVYFAGQGHTHPDEMKFFRDVVKSGRDFNRLVTMAAPSRAQAMIDVKAENRRKSKRTVK